MLQEYVGTDVKHLKIQVNYLISETRDTYEIMCQTWGSSIDELFQNGRTMGLVDYRVVIQVPLTEMGVPAAKQLTKLSVKVCLTGCMDSKQALIAASMGVDYIEVDINRYVTPCSYPWIKYHLSPIHFYSSIVGSATRKKLQWQNANE